MYDLEKLLKIFNCTVSDGEREGMILSIDFWMSRSLNLQDDCFLKGWDLLVSWKNEFSEKKEDILSWDLKHFSKIILVLPTFVLTEMNGGESLNS